MRTGHQQALLHQLFPRWKDRQRYNQATVVEKERMIDAAIKARPKPIAAAPTPPPLFSNVTISPTRGTKP